MANFVFNRAKGRVTELAERVNANDPANSVFLVIVINAGATTDAVAMDLDTMAQIEADAGIAEVTNTGYARKVLSEAGGIVITYDDTNDRVDIDVPDQTWTGVAAGSAWTDVIFAYDNDSTVVAEASIVPMTQHDFAITPDGSDITAQVPSPGFHRAA